MKSVLRRGVTLIEAVLFISIALGLIVGGLVFFQQASLASRVNAQVRVLSAIVQETRALYNQSGAYNTLVPFDLLTLFTAGTRVDEVLIAAGAVPSNIITPPTGPFSTSLRNEWNNGIGLSVGSLPGGRATLAILVVNIPKAACVRLSAVDAIGSGVFADSVEQIFFIDEANGSNSTLLFPPITPGDAAGPNGCDVSATNNVSMIYLVSLF
jgi:hypothetical protein